jgi:4'-phosphopantetheinyl transferase
VCAPEVEGLAGFERMWKLLDADERSAAERFMFPEDRRNYVFSHGLLRSVLSPHVKLPPSQIRFEKADHGRPELAATENAPSLRFNLSHANGLVGCAVTFGRDIGFDLEQILRPAPLEIAERFFSDQELFWLRALEPSEQHEGFYALWTLKEAYAKGRGLGLRLPFRAFAIEPASSGTAELVVTPEDDFGRWTLHHRRLADHAVALAVRAAESEVELTWFGDDGLVSALD